MTAELLTTQSSSLEGKTYEWAYFETGKSYWVDVVAYCECDDFDGSLYGNVGFIFEPVADFGADLITTTTSASANSFLVRPVITLSTSDIK